MWTCGGRDVCSILLYCKLYRDRIPLCTNKRNLAVDLNIQSFIHASSILWYPCFVMLCYCELSLLAWCEKVTTWSKNTRHQICQKMFHCLAFSILPLCFVKPNQRPIVQQLRCAGWFKFTLMCHCHPAGRVWEWNKRISACWCQQGSLTLCINKLYSYRVSPGNRENHTWIRRALTVWCAYVGFNVCLCRYMRRRRFVSKNPSLHSAAIQIASHLPFPPHVSLTKEAPDSTSAKLVPW